MLIRWWLLVSSKGLAWGWVIPQSINMINMINISTVLESVIVTPFFGVPQMLTKTMTWEQCPQMLTGKARAKWQIDPFLPICNSSFCDTPVGVSQLIEGVLKGTLKSATAPKRIYWTLQNSDLFRTRVWCIPEFGAEGKSGFRGKTKRAPNPGTHQLREPIRPKSLGMKIHPPNLGDKSSKITCFTVLQSAHSLNSGGEIFTPKFGEYGFSGKVRLKRFPQKISIEPLTRLKRFYCVTHSPPLSGYPYKTPLR